MTSRRRVKQRWARWMWCAAKTSKNEKTSRNMLCIQHTRAHVSCSFSRISFHSSFGNWHRKVLANGSTTAASLAQMMIEMIDANNRKPNVHFNVEPSRLENAATTVWYGINFHSFGPFGVASKSNAKLFSTKNTHNYRKIYQFKCVPSPMQRQTI